MVLAVRAMDDKNNFQSCFAVLRVDAFCCDVMYSQLIFLLWLFLVFIRAHFQIAIYIFEFLDSVCGNVEAYLLQAEFLTFREQNWEIFFKDWL